MNDTHKLWTTAVLLVIALWIWVLLSILEVGAYNRITGARLRPVDAMFVQLRVCTGPVQP